jgi:tRNA1Val (adenine37-N6)-methyltransferase
VARHEIAGHLGDFLAAARYGLRPKGTTYLIYPAFRLAALLSSLAEVGMRPEWLQFVQPRMSQPATLVLCAARVGGSVQLVVRPPLAIHEAERHTPIVAELLAGRRVRYPGEPGGEWQ